MCCHLESNTGAVLAKFQAISGRSWQHIRFVWSFNYPKNKHMSLFLKKTWLVPFIQYTTSTGGSSVPRQTYQEQLHQQAVSLQNAEEVERAQQGGTVWKRCFFFVSGGFIFILLFGRRSLCWCATVSLKHNRLVGASLFRMGFKFNLGHDVCTKEASMLGFRRLWVFWFRLVDPRKAWLWDGNHRNRDPGTFNTCAASYSLGASSAFLLINPKLHDHTKGKRETTCNIYSSSFRYMLMAPW